MANAVLFPGSICSRLVDAGIITEAQAQEALEIQKTSKALIGSILTQLGYCTEDDIARIMAQKSGYRYVSINEIGVNVAAANLITPEMALRNNVLPLYQEDKTLYVAMKNPNDIITIDNLHLMTGLEICPLVVADMELAAARRAAVPFSGHGSRRCQLSGGGKSGIMGKNHERGKKPC